MFDTLEVGSGAFPEGDVNIERYVTDKERVDYGLKTIFTLPEYFVKADAHCLPFKNEMFEKVICDHVLEHLDCPYKALVEAFRVLKSDGIIDVRLPNAKLITVEHKTHLYSWSPMSISNLLKKVGFKIEKLNPEVRSLNMELIAKK